MTSTGPQGPAALAGGEATRDATAGNTAGTCGLAIETDPVGATVAHSPDCDLRLKCRDGTLSANKCVLCRASTVLRQTLGLQLPTPGELALPTDSAAAWEVVLSLLSLEAYPLQLVTMDNLAALLVLADKYDIPVVRGACAHFLHIHAPQLRISAPLASTANVLTAASLAIKYCSTHPILEPYCATVRARLDAELAVLRRPPDAAVGADGAPVRDATNMLLWQMDVMRLVGTLESMVGTEEYLQTVVPEVQFAVSGAMLAGLRHLASRLPPFCQTCSSPLPTGTDAFHADCAATHFTQLYTRGCRLCSVSMPPSHARFCNSCAYRRHK